MSSAENGTGIGAAGREPRGSRRRPGVAPPRVEKIRPKSGLSREEVVANQRCRIFDGLALALVHHGYEDTKVSDVVELAGLSRATFYQHFKGKEACFAAAYEDGVERVADAVEGAASAQPGWDAGVSAGLRGGLELLAADPPLAHLLLVEALAAARPARLEHERSLVRLAEALRPPPELPGGEALPEETLRLLAGGLASHLAGRVLAGEADRLADDHDVLLRYLLAPTGSAVRAASA